MVLLKHPLTHDGPRRPGRASAPHPRSGTVKGCAAADCPSPMASPLPILSIGRQSARPIAGAGLEWLSAWVADAGAEPARCRGLQPIGPIMLRRHLKATQRICAGRTGGRRTQARSGRRMQGEKARLPSIENALETGGRRYGVHHDRPLNIADFAGGRCCAREEARDRAGARMARHHDLGHAGGAGSGRGSGHSGQGSTKVQLALRPPGADPWLNRWMRAIRQGLRLPDRGDRPLGP